MNKRKAFDFGQTGGLFGGWMRLMPRGWMSQLNFQYRLASKPSPLISNINIPGTHESGAICGSVWQICVAYTIQQQLAMGYRWFDIRLKLRKNEFGIYHGKIKAFEKKQPDLWYDVHETLKQFLSDTVSKNECIMIKVKNEAKSKPKEFAAAFAAMIQKYQQNDMSGNNIYYFNQNRVPTLTECAGKVIILGNGKWAEMDEWTKLNPVPWIDINYSKKSDAAKFNKGGIQQRVGKWKKALEKTISDKAPRDRRIYRNGINANSKSKSKVSLKGTPLQWAEQMNPMMFGIIQKLSFPLPSTGDIQCEKRNYGVVVWDLPKKTPKFFGQRLPILVIMSNCELFEAMDPKHRDWNHPDQVIEGLNFDAKSLARNSNYGVNMIDTQQYES